MAFLNTLLLIILMAMSWNVIHAPQSITEDAHLNIQADLQNIIRNVIQEKAPSASDIIFHQFWTEALSDTQVKARFKYSFSDNGGESGPSKITLDGYAIVNQSEEYTDSVPVWYFEEFYLLDNKIEYAEPLTISPNSEGE